MLIAVVSVFLVVGCKKEEAKAPPKPATPATPTPPPIATPKGTRGPNSDKTDILGKWNAKGTDELQFEFTPTNLTIRKDAGLKDVTTVQYTLRNELSPSQIDWGTGTGAGYGLYTLEGDQLWIDYNLGSPELRPKRPGKSPTANQIEFRRVK